MIGSVTVQWAEGGTFGKFEYTFSGLNGYFLVNIDHFWTNEKEISSKSQLEKNILQNELGQ